MLNVKAKHQSVKRCENTGAMCRWSVKMTTGKIGVSEVHLVLKHCKLCNKLIDVMTLFHFPKNHAMNAFTGGSVNYKCLQKTLSSTQCHHHHHHHHPRTIPHRLLLTGWWHGVTKGSNLFAGSTRQMSSSFYSAKSWNSLPPGNYQPTVP